MGMAQKAVAASIRKEREDLFTNVADYCAKRKEMNEKPKTASPLPQDKLAGLLRLAADGNRHALELLAFDYSVLQEVANLVSEETLQKMEKGSP